MSKKTCLFPAELYVHRNCGYKYWTKLSHKTSCLAQVLKETDKVLNMYQKGFCLSNYTSLWHCTSTEHCHHLLSTVTSRFPCSHFVCPFNCYYFLRSMAWNGINRCTHHSITPRDEFVWLLFNTHWILQ